MSDESVFGAGLTVGIVGVLIVMILCAMAFNEGERAQCRDVVKALQIAKQAEALAVLQHINCGGGK